MMSGGNPIKIVLILTVIEILKFAHLHHLNILDEPMTYSVLMNNYQNIKKKKNKKINKNKNKLKCEK